MEYRSQALAPTLASAVSLFARLNEAGVRYGIFKSSRNTLMALAGDQDLDILVAREDYNRFCSIAAECAAIRSINHPSLMSPGREDWFVPDFERAKYLHLDVHVSVRLGGKFNKCYPCYSYDDIHHWELVTFGQCSIPVASPPDEAGVTLSRIAFRSASGVAGPWMALSGDWAREIDEIVFAEAETGLKDVWCRIAGTKVRCRVRKRVGQILVYRRDLANIREAVRRRSGAPVYSALTDQIVNGARAFRYAASRVMKRVIPGSIDRRRPAGGGLLVAVIAPDGMGKTTQVDRIFRLFEWKFCCARLYLGSGDGRGWWLRRVIRTLYIRRRSSIRAAFLDERAGTGSRGLKARLGDMLLAIWGALVALERYFRVRSARRLADGGLLVFCDRWPQALEAGLMDGPTQSRGPNPLRRWEMWLYERMSRIQPDVIVHLIGDYPISQARKPGELSREEFDKRISLMVAMRATTPEVRVISAAGDVDQVARSLFALVWKVL